MHTIEERSDLKDEFQIKELSEVIGKSHSEIQQIVSRDHYRLLWTYMVNCILGVWLISSPHLFDYQSSALAVSDTIAGVLIIIFELLAFASERAVLRWGTPVVAFWLLFAPLVFWSKTPAVFLLDTLIACLVIVFSILVPGVPGRPAVELPGPDQPPGWTYNPSSWIRRWLGIALALLGFFISRYLAAHQLGYIAHAYDPFFGDGTDKVTGSAVSRAFPISDAGFGSVAYVMESLTGFMGDRARWRTAPWTAVLSALLVLPLGATSIILMVMQPVVVGAWCGLCLISAAALLSSVPLAVHEAIAVGQFLLAAKRRGKNLWQIFWLGGSIIGAGNNDPDRMHYNLGQRWLASVQGVTVPFSILIQAAIGIWLLARPDLLHFSDVASANCDHLIGAMVVTVAAIASAEVTRIARYLNMVLGVILLISSLVFSLHFPVVMVSELVSGALLIGVSLPKGRIVERYAAWDRFVA